MHVPGEGVSREGENQKGPVRVVFMESRKGCGGEHVTSDGITVTLAEMLENDVLDVEAFR